jgi:AcrR family transcriptional regulator
VESRRGVNKLKRRQRILDTAAKLIAEDGIKACTMRRLARRARLDVTTLYNHYGSKAEILEELRRAGARKVAARIGAVADEEPLTRVRAIVHAALGVRESPADLVRPSRRLRPGEGQVGAVVRDALVPELRRAAADGLLNSAIDADLLAMAILERFHVWLQLWASGALDPDEVAARVDCGLDLTLLAAATSSTRRRLELALLASQGRLSALLAAKSRRERPKARRRASTRHQ